MSHIATPPLDKLIGAYFNKAYTHRVLQPVVPMDKNQREEMLEVAIDDEAGVFSEYSNTKGSRAKDIHGLTQQFNLPSLELGSHEAIHLAEKLYMADMHVAELWTEKLRNPAKIPQPRGDFAPKVESISAPQSAGMDNLGSAGAIKVKDLIAKFAAHKEKKGRWRAATLKDNVTKLELFAEFVGEDCYIHTLLPQDFAAYDDALSRMPRNMNKMPKYRHMSLRQAALRSKDGDVVTPQTASKHFDNTRWMFDYAVNVIHLKQNPVPSLRKDNVYEKAERSTFTSEQLAILFGSESFNQAKYHKKSGEFWVPLLAAFTGARLNELVGLEVADVIHYDGYHYLYIRPNSLRKLKNKTSQRLIPLHPDLIQAGFLKYVDLMHAKKRKAVFHDLHNNVKPADAMTKKFAKLLIELGLKSKQDRKGLCFHSFRHTVANRLLELGVSRELRMGIMGHAIPDTQSDYVKAFPVSLTHPEICKLTYGFDLKELLVVNRD